MKIPVILLIITATAMADPLLKWTDSQKQLISAIKPTQDETGWMKIDWRTNLWEARKEAAKAGKPIYLWEMDGHPLGCT